MEEHMTAAQLYQMGKNYFLIRNYDEAKGYLMASVSKGNSSAAGLLYELGQRYMKEKTDETYQSAEECFQVLAERGHGGGCLALGKICEQGLGREADMESAFSYYAEAYRMGEIRGAYRAGCLLMPSARRSQDIRKTAEEWFLEAAEGGIFKAYTKLGWMYREDDPVNSKDNRIALSWFLKGADKGDAEALRAAGDFFFDGVAVAKDPEAGLKFFLKASEKGDARADLRLGDIYASGNCVKKNVEKAIDYYKQAEARGERDGSYYGGLTAFHEGKRYLDGEEVRRNRGKALKFLTAAAEFGYTPAFNEIGVMYCTAASGPYKNKETALEWFRRGMAAGDKEYAASNYVQLCMELGERVLYRDSLQRKPGMSFTEKQEEEHREHVHQACAYFKMAAAKGCADGWAELAIQYFSRGDMLGVSEADFLKAAEKGKKGEETDSFFVLWAYYAKRELWGKSCFHQENPAKAFAVAMEAAKRGAVFFMETVSNYYREGYGVAKDEGRAMMWQIKARDQAERNMASHKRK